MKNRSLLGLFILLLATFLCFFVYPYFRPPELPDVSMSALGAETVRARVVEIIEEGEIDLGGVTQRYQIARVELLEGEYQGIVMEMDYGRRQILSSALYLEPGDPILVTIGSRPDGMLTVYFVDFIRTTPMLWLAAIFAVAILVISRWKGLRSLLSMAFSLMVIISFIIPRILSGDDPLLVSIVGSIALLGVTLYLTYGWNLKTHAAVISMILVLFITGGLAGLFVVFTRLTGAGDENALFLLQMLDARINLRGLLLGGMIIGALGVLDDLVTTQASAVFELHHANSTLGFRALFQSAMRIGQDHVAATVNTLVLAYAGASLPMLLMFTLGRGDYGYLVNFQIVAEEIVRTLVGSLGLISAVPLTTAIAILFALRADSLGKWRQFLGPEGGGEGHAHVH
ncbi:MAG: YibE/F family protein [Anaerolineales bacterium]|nr:YibE/F family protein [Anaerolineae bacterium]PWB70360.1 MAG: YibE/F family protein [Anaerolineales bacterium]